MILGHHVHALLRTDHLKRTYGLCGKRARSGSTEPSKVTCERCQASIRKRARAIAREEGRAL